MGSATASASPAGGSDGDGGSDGGDDGDQRKGGANNATNSSDDSDDSDGSFLSVSNGSGGGGKGMGKGKGKGKGRGGAVDDGLSFENFALIFGELFNDDGVSIEVPQALRAQIATYVTLPREWLQLALHSLSWNRECIVLVAAVAVAAPPAE